MPCGILHPMVWGTLWTHWRSLYKVGFQTVWNQCMTKRVIKCHKLCPKLVYTDSFRQFRTMMMMTHKWGLCCQKQVSQAGISNYIPQFTVGCNWFTKVILLFIIIHNTFWGSLCKIITLLNTLTFPVNTLRQRQNGHHFPDGISWMKMWSGWGFEVSCGGHRWQRGKCCYFFNSFFLKVNCGL